MYTILIYHKLDNTYSLVLVNSSKPGKDLPSPYKMDVFAQGNYKQVFKTALDSDYRIIRTIVQTDTAKDYFDNLN